MNTEAQAQAKLLARLPAIRDAAIGKPFSIRQDKNNLTRGVITNVEFGYWTYTARAIQMVFKVTMECGSAKAVKQFHVQKVPA